MVTFARSLRMELSQEKTESNSTELKEGKEPPSLLEGLDLDSLPADARERLTAKDTELKSIYAKQKELEETTERLKGSVQHFQSLADKRGNQLKSHNLPEDGQVVAEKKTLADTMAAKLMAKGMKEAVARSYADMFGEVAPDIIGEAVNQATSRVMPLAETVSGMKAEQAFQIAASAERDPQRVLSNPEVEKEVKDQINFLQSQGTAVTVEMVEQLKHMAWGKAVAADPTIVNRQNTTHQTVRMSSGGAGTGFGSVRVPDNGAKGEPQSVNAETAAAWNATKAIMLKGMKPK